MILWVKNSYLASRNAKYKDVNTITKQNQRYTCIPRANYTLKVHKCTLHVLSVMTCDQHIVMT